MKMAEKMSRAGKGKGGSMEGGEKKKKMASLKKVGWKVTEKSKTN